MSEYLSRASSYETCHKDRLDLIDLLIQHGAVDLRDGLYVACLVGNRDLMISKGASYCFCGTSLANH